jgi:hypothetical protein
MKNLAILCYSQHANDPREDLGKFGYKLNMNLNSNFSKTSFNILATYLNHGCKFDVFSYILVEFLLLKISKSI